MEVSGYERMESTVREEIGSRQSQAECEDSVVG